LSATRNPEGSAGRIFFAFSTGGVVRFNTEALSRKIAPKNLRDREPEKISSLSLKRIGEFNQCKCN
jgi:hypothetical protein